MKYSKIKVSVHDIAAVSKLIMRERGVTPSVWIEHMKQSPDAYGDRVVLDSLPFVQLNPDAEAWKCDRCIVVVLVHDVTPERIVFTIARGDTTTDTLTESQVPEWVDVGLVFPVR